ncbi:MAG: hypothetical protein EZS28_029865 [Streblomastix strix]|uniref:Uncharacterized protein n=1 Tax=Streblomastix strix TaxID=222440 RepID=A0A5J4UVU8_9EUKA|nr:MAG: hypothetical protein EZS28_029865 [Streblomastix strix]
MIGQLGVEDEQKDDCIDLCIPLSKLLFSYDNELQRRGKNAIMNLIEQNENIVSGLLQIGFLDRSSDTLNNIPSQSSSSSSQTTITSSSSFVMNILTILDQIITITSEKIPKSGKIMKTLDQLKKTGETVPIRRKAKNIQDQINEEGQINEPESDNEQSKEKIISLEDRIRTLEEQIRNKDERERIQKQEKIDSDQQIDTLKKDKNEAMRISSQISKRMNDHIKSMVNESDLEKLRMIPWIEMCKDLSKQIVPGQEGLIDLQRQIEICEYLIEMFKNSKINDEYRKRCIQSGIVKILLNIFENWKVEDIKFEHVKAFFKLTLTNNNEIQQLLFTLNPFKGLLNLLNHSNSGIQSNGIDSIFNIQIGGSNTTLLTEVHPYFDAIASIGGTEKIYEFMNRKNTNKGCKDTAAIIIGYFHRARKIENIEIRINVIKHLKSIVNDKDNWTKNESRKALRYLAQNSDNKTEIEKDGFMIPT